jgi:tetratricopeptide (TPR) repeat protein
LAGVGAGVAIAAPLAAVDARALAVVAGARLVSFAVSPGPPRRIDERPSEYGAAYDFVRLVRLERLMSGARRLLAARYPDLPRGAAVGHHHLPHLTRFAFAGGKALRVWYRDTTLRWVDFEDLRERVDPALATIVEYQPQGEPQLALVEPDAMRAMLEAGAALDRQEWSVALERLDRADSSQRDHAARVFLALVEGKRALARAYRRETLAAEDAARRSLALWRDDTDARLVLAGLWSSEGRLGEAMEQIDSLLAVDPADRRALELGVRIRAAAGRSP